MREPKPLTYVRAMSKEFPWEALEERANRAILEARALIATRQYLLEEMAQTYRYRLLAAQKATLQTRKAETALAANVEIWRSGTTTLQKST